MKITVTQFMKCLECKPFCHAVLYDKFCLLNKYFQFYLFFLY